MKKERPMVQKGKFNMGSWDPSERSISRKRGSLVSSTIDRSHAMMTVIAGFSEHTYTHYTCTHAHMHMHRPQICLL